MADSAIITPASANEDAFDIEPSPINLLFSKMLGQMVTVIDREKEIDGVDIFDPAFKAWLSGAENALDAFTQSVCVLSNLSPMIASDVPLRRTARLIHAMINAASRSELATARSNIVLYAGNLLDHEGAYIGRDTVGQLKRCRALLKVLMQLDLYRHSPDDTLSKNEISEIAT